MPDRHCPKGAAAGPQFVLLPVCRYSSCMPGLCGGMLKAPAAERQRSGPLQPTVARERTTAKVSWPLLASTLGVPPAIGRDLSSGVKYIWRNGLNKRAGVHDSPYAAPVVLALA